MCPSCGATHPARTTEPAPARPVPLSGVAPEPTQPPPPMRVAGPHTSSVRPNNRVRPSASMHPDTSMHHGEPSPAPAPPRPPAPPPDLQPTTGTSPFAILLVALLAVPLVMYVYDGVSTWLDDADNPDDTIVVGWEQAPYQPGSGEAAPPPTDAPPDEVARVEEAKLAALPPPEIPKDFEPSAPFTPGELPSAPPIPVPAPAPEAPDDDAEAVVQELGALRTDRVVVRLHSTPAGADVDLDGRSRGRTPAKLMLNPGQYTIGVSYGDAHAELEVDATHDTRLCFALEGGQLANVDCTTVL